MLEVTKQQSDATDDGIAVKVWGTYRLASHMSQLTRQKQISCPVTWKQFLCTWYALITYPLFLLNKPSKPSKYEWTVTWLV